MAACRDGKISMPIPHSLIHVTNRSNNHIPQHKISSLRSTLIPTH